MNTYKKWKESSKYFLQFSKEGRSSELIYLMLCEEYLRGIDKSITNILIQQTEIDINNMFQQNKSSRKPAIKRPLTNTDNLLSPMLTPLTSADNHLPQMFISGSPMITPLTNADNQLTQMLISGSPICTSGPSQKKISFFGFHNGAGIDKEGRIVKMKDNGKKKIEIIEILD